MGHHREWHPYDVAGCFGCQTLNVGVQTLQIKHGNDPVQKVPVVTEEGPNRGKVGGVHAVHWDGRQDATVKPAPIALTTTVKG